MTSKNFRFEDDLKFEEEKNCFELSLDSPTNVTKQDLLKSSYFPTFPGGWLGGGLELKLKPTQLNIICLFKLSLAKFSVFCV